MRAGGDPTVMGDVVNTAQRLEKLGEPGQVIVGPATDAATRDAIRYEALGPQAPARAARSRSRRSARSTRSRRPAAAGRAQQAPLVGRDAELATLAQVVAMATTRERAQLVLLVGRRRRRQEPPRERARRARGRASSARCVLTGECVPYGDANAFGAVAEALRQASCDDDGPNGRHRRQDAHRREDASHVLGARHRAGRARTHGRRPAATSSKASPGPASTRAARATTRCGRRSRSSKRSRRAAPLVLVLSDLHWATDDALELCERLLARLRNRPFVLVATARPDLETRWTPEPGKYNGITLQLDPLDARRDRRARARAALRRADDETVDAPARTQRRQPVLRRGARRVRAGVGRHREHPHEVPATLHGLARGAARRARPGRALAARRLRGRRRATGRSRRSLALADRADARRCSTARRTRPPRARRRRVPLQVRAHPRDRVRHAHQGRAGPPPRACRARCSRRAASRRSTRSRITSRPRPSSSTSSARSPAFPPTCASRPSPR